MNQKCFTNVILIVLIAVVVATAGYFLLVKSKPTPPEETPPITEDEFKDWKTYRNEEYGFEIKIPVQWSGYKTTKEVSDGVSHFYFSLPTKEKGWSGYANLFAISIYTKDQFENFSKNSEPDTPQIGGITIGQDDRNVAVASYSQVAPPNDLKDAVSLRENILSTFKFIP